ncbi:glycosyltransferase family 4 protein [Mycobacterium sp. 1274761.0]|uniref:glycosyltransferase family 4 protein n=1 Tax=Mycobacterium sp. 1274761.0 TaxID=1834077 RepID=UPI0007FF1CA3|nr:glycosyltransferase family 4 protein [Mycobacterium sp. 1274761.0]OBK74416.1 glycosyl transferase [Mycobacterium sp. 1274761.0]
MSEPRALWVSTSTETKGGIATYVRAMQSTRMWTDWNVRHVTSHRDGSTATKVSTFVSGTIRFVIELIRLRPSVCHLHASTGGSLVRKLILFWIARAWRVPVVIHMHGSNFQSFYENSPVPVQAVIRETVSRASCFVALGDIWATRLRGYFPNARVFAIPNAVQLGRCADQAARGAEPVHVVFLGRIGDRKGTFALLDAWAELSRDPEFSDGRGTAAVLTVAGDGEVERARKRIRELDVEGSVDIHDWLSKTEVEKLLDSAQVFLLPSRSEGQPMAVLEAMARGLCVIASDVGGLPEMIGGGCGVMVSPDDVDSIADALRRVVYDQELRARYGAAAYQRIKEQFDINAVSRRLDALYREVSR